MLSVVSCFIFEAGSYYVIQAAYALEFLLPQPFSVGFTGVCCHTWLLYIVSFLETRFHVAQAGLGLQIFLNYLLCSIIYFPTGF